MTDFIARINPTRSGAASLLALALFFTPTAHAVNSGCAELADARQAGLPGPAAGIPKVLCAAFFPFAIKTDASEAARVEVRIEGGGVTAAAIGNLFAVVGVTVQGVAFPQTGSFIDLYDDGTHGDRVASDGIWSRGDVRINATPIPPVFMYNFDRLRYTNGSGTSTITINSANTVGQYGPARLGRLDPALVTPAVSQGDGFWTTDNVVIIDDDAIHAETRWLLYAANPPADINSVTQRFYERYPDLFDFILLMPGSHTPGKLAGVYLSASNNVSGIGRPISDDTADWGSAGRLQSVVPINLSDSGPVLHELTHRWGIFVGAPIGLQQCAPVHVGLAGVGCGPLGGFDGSTLVDNGDGTWTASNSCFSVAGPPADTRVMNPLNLYLAGLIPKSQVPPFPVPVNADCFSITQNFAENTFTFAADDVVTRTIDDIISEAGARIPNASNSQKAFRMAWVVPMNRPPTATEAGWFQYRSEYVGRQENGDQPFRVTFYESTGGRATLDTTVPVFGPLIFEDGFESP